ncbi:MAG: helicase HerA domain-containing protein [Candidatus Woesearchaeota archaeon]
MIVKGQIVRGGVSELLLRKKQDVDVELGELLVVEDGSRRVLCQVSDLSYGSQISSQNLEYISGIDLEEDFDTQFMDGNLRHYVLCHINPVLVIGRDGKTRGPSVIPPLFSYAREVGIDDFSFLPRSGMQLGLLRSGKETLDIPLCLDAVDVASHHVLITGTTGKGKSVLMKNILWEMTREAGVASLVFDPHDEYYGNGHKRKGLKDTDVSGRISYYTPSHPPVGQSTFKINVSLLRPEHFSLVGFSSAQRQALQSYFKTYGKKWVEAVLMERSLNDEYNDATLQVVKRRLSQLLQLQRKQGSIIESSVFSLSAGASTISDIADALEKARTVIVDTSPFSGTIELLLANLITSEVFNRYRQYKLESIQGKPVVSVVLEEAPRVLGRDVLEHGPNVFASIAREGRKFGVGLVAITQMPSLIPKELLANMNTKVILGTEMSQERAAIIDSASHDLSKDSRTIASLSKGEALISSNFSPLALPTTVPFFDEEVEKFKKKTSKTSQEVSATKKFSGIDME